MPYNIERKRDFDRAHGIRGDVIYIIMKGNALCVQIKILDGNNFSGRTVSEVFQCFAGRYPVVRHQLIPYQFCQWFFVFGDEKIVETERSYQREKIGRASCRERV